jgi:hypothetical protein
MYSACGCKGVLACAKVFHKGKQRIKLQSTRVHILQVTQMLFSQTNIKARKAKRPKTPGSRHVQSLDHSIGALASHAPRPRHKPRLLPAWMLHAKGSTREILNSLMHAASPALLPGWEKMFVFTKTRICLEPRKFNGRSLNDQVGRCTGCVTAACRSSIHSPFRTFQLRVIAIQFHRPLCYRLPWHHGGICPCLGFSVGSEWAASDGPLMCVSFLHPQTNFAHSGSTSVRTHC